MIVSFCPSFFSSYSKNSKLFKLNFKKLFFQKIYKLKRVIKGYEKGQA